MFRNFNYTTIDTVETFTFYNPIILKGVLAVSVDNGGVKVGDGVNRWVDLSYVGGSSIGSKLVELGTPFHHEIPRYNSTSELWEYTLQGYKDTKSNWESVDDIFPSFCILIEMDDLNTTTTGRVKFSDGKTPAYQIPWIWFNFSEFPTNKSIYYNGTELGFKEFQEINTLARIDTPEGKFHRDDGTWALPEIFTNVTLIDSTLIETDNIYISDSISLGGFPTEPTSVTITSDGTDLFIDSQKVWTQYNDGTGSGLDADTLDGHHSTTFATGPETVTAGNIITFGASPNILIDSGFSLSDFAELLYVNQTFPTAPDITTVDHIVTFDSSNGLKLSDSGHTIDEFATTGDITTVDENALIYAIIMGG